MNTRKNCPASRMSPQPGQDITPVERHESDVAIQFWKRTLLAISYKGAQESTTATPRTTPSNK